MLPHRNDVIEEEFDDKSTSGRKTSEVHMSSGIAMVGRPKDDEWDSVPVLETVTKTTKIITQKFESSNGVEVVSKSLTLDMYK